MRVHQFGEPALTRFIQNYEVGMRYRWNRGWRVSQVFTRPARQSGLSAGCWRTGSATSPPTSQASPRPFVPSLRAHQHDLRLCSATAWAIFGRRIQLSVLSRSSAVNTSPQHTEPGITLAYDLHAN